MTIFIVAVIAGAITNGWALTMLWSWFIVPVFGLPILSLPQAIGVAMVITFLTKHAIRENKGKDKDIWIVIGEVLGAVIAIPIFVVCIGYIVTLFL